MEPYDRLCRLIRWQGMIDRLAVQVILWLTNLSYSSIRVFVKCISNVSTVVVEDVVGKTVIDVKDARKTYVMGQERIKAVDGVSFTIEEGEFCCILGTSGSGKSTLLNLLAGIEKLSGGEIIINGSSIRKMSEKKLSKFRQENLGFVFQAYNLLGSMTALENVELPLVFKRISPGKRKRMARSILKKVGLGDRMDHKPKEMSGGQQQRVGIARAFVAKPKIVFADEPTGNLDSKTTIEVMQLIKGMALKNKQTIVMVTHDVSLARYADKIIHVSDGKIIEIEHNEHPLEGHVPEDSKKDQEAVNTAAENDNGAGAETIGEDRAGSVNETGAQDSSGSENETVATGSMDSQTGTAAKDSSGPETEADPHGSAAKTEDIPDKNEENKE